MGGMKRQPYMKEYPKKGKMMIGETIIEETEVFLFI